MVMARGCSLREPPNSHEPTQMTLGRDIGSLDAVESARYERNVSF